MLFYLKKVKKNSCKTFTLQYNKNRTRDLLVQKIDELIQCQLLEPKITLVEKSGKVRYLIQLSSLQLGKCEFIHLYERSPLPYSDNRTQIKLYIKTY